jgi:hypothetical protein
MRWLAQWKPWKRHSKNSKTVAEEILRLFFAGKKGKLPLQSETNLVYYSVTFYIGGVCNESG